MNSCKSKSSVWVNQYSSLYFQLESTCQYNRFRVTEEEQALPRKGFPSSKRGNNTIWHNRQNGQTAVEQPAQTQVVHVYRWLSGRRGTRVLCSHSTQVKVEREEISTYADNARVRILHDP